MFYTMWFEHKINGIVGRLCTKRRLSARVPREVIRRSRMQDKCTWVLRLLGTLEIKPDHVKRVQAVEDVRNAFVHYKWVPDDTGESKQRAESALRGIEKAVRYFQDRENRLFWKSSTRRLRKAVRLRPGTRAAKRAPRR